MSIYRKIMKFRSCFPKSQRESVCAIARYDCVDCLISIPVDICVGVGMVAWTSDGGIYMDYPIFDCPACGGKKKMVMTSLEELPGDRRQSLRVDRWAIRIPSRRAAVALARSEEFSAQVIKPEIDIWS